MNLCTYINGLNKSKPFEISELEEALNISKDDNLSMIIDSIKEIKKHNKEPIFDAEHFFDGFKGDSKISTWIYSLTLNKSKEILRHKTRKKRFGYLKVIDEQTENFLVECKHPGILLEDKELASILFEALDKLPENQRIAYNLSKIEGLSYSETAEYMGLSVSSVESLLFRAKKNLQENLKEYYKNQ